MRIRLGMILWLVIYACAQPAYDQGVLPPAPVLRPVIEPVAPALPVQEVAPEVVPAPQPPTIKVEELKKKIPFKEAHPKIYNAYRKARTVVIATKPFIEVAGATCNIFILAFVRGK